MQRKSFFDAVRSNPFKGSLGAKQVAGMDAILDEWDRYGLTDLRWLAYMLATAYHETARTMQPIREYGQRPYFDKYEPYTRVGKVLGNTVSGDGARFKGRGYVQLTGRRNYALAGKKLGVDLVSNPDLALDPHHAARIMFEGMIDGWFTGKKLTDYFNDSKSDWVNARRIINGTDKAQTIAGYAKTFYDALRGAAVPVDAADEAPDVPKPAYPPPPDIVPTPSTQPPQGGFFNALLALVAKWFSLRS
jgi:putative chitinase